MMASESSLRRQQFLKNSCNAFNLKRPKSTPIAFWFDDDVWSYIKDFKISYSSIYDKGYKRTGCMFCLFGLEEHYGMDRFEYMEKTHPKQYSYCMNNLGLRKVLDFVRNRGNDNLFDNVI